jgi:hypothetical protein
MKRKYKSIIDQLITQRNRDLQDYTATLQDMQRQIDELRAANPPPAAVNRRRVRILSEDEEN